MSKVQSTTLWITISIIILNPFAWFLQYLFNRWNMEYLIEKGVKAAELTPMLNYINFDLPIQTLATATVTAVGLYIGGQKAKSVSYNVGKPAGSGVTEQEEDK